MKCSWGEFPPLPEHAIHSFFHRDSVVVHFRAQEKETSKEVSFFIGTKGYFGAGVVARGVVVAGRGRAADGAAGGGAATPEEALYAVTTAWVTSVLGTAHMMMLFC
jgi:hypothetical protein